jgi:hypothetical protein
MVTQLLLISNPFIEAYFQSDLMGKAIFIGLYLLSIITWVVIGVHLWNFLVAKKKSSKI